MYHDYSTNIFSMQIILKRKFYGIAHDVVFAADGWLHRKFIIWLIFSALSIMPALFSISCELPQTSNKVATSDIVFINNIALTVSSDSFATNVFLLCYLYLIVIDAFAAIGIHISIKKLEAILF